MRHMNIRTDTDRILMSPELENRFSEGTLAPEKSVEIPEASSLSVIFDFSSGLVLSGNVHRLVAGPEGKLKVTVSMLIDEAVSLISIVRSSSSHVHCASVRMVSEKSDILLQASASYIQKVVMKDIDCFTGICHVLVVIT